MDRWEALSSVRICTNLRSRGDGPQELEGRLLGDSKPPLTRRWTRHYIAKHASVPQTSAHAEMDPAKDRESGWSDPNLRSRGDGPISIASPLQKKIKPPLTRRWTLSVSADTRSYTQTSAHAEMDLLRITAFMSSIPNLRSRGDGPVQIDGCANYINKPPLTRRWTYSPQSEGCRKDQTSAHAEMDRARKTRKTGATTNLRSRGDGPSLHFAISATRGKPPLTRRWTSQNSASIGASKQTSAHAEMDRRFRLRDAGGDANLRSRGDGPGYWYGGG